MPPERLRFVKCLSPARCRSDYRETIPAITLNLESIVAGEFAENEFRKQFTASERVAIGEAIEKELGNRHGQRTDLAAIAAKLDCGETVDLAARRAGF